MANPMQPVNKPFAIEVTCPKTGTDVFRHNGGVPLGRRRVVVEDVRM